MSNTEPLAVPTVDELLGCAPDWTGEMSTDEYIEYQREEPQP